MPSVNSNGASQIYVHYKTGVRLFDEKNYQAAITQLQMYLDKEQHPEVDAYLYLGKALFLTGQQLIAIDQLRKFITKSESANLPYAYDLLGQCYAALNDISNATINYQLATQMEPACASAWHNWGLLHMTSAEHSLKGKLHTCIESLKSAKQCFMNSLKNFAHHPIFLNSLAGWHERYVTVLENLVDQNEEICGNYNLAIKYYQDALAHCDVNDVPFKNIVTSNLVECWTQYGHHLYKLGNYKEALANYLAVLEKDGSNIPAINQAGMCLFKQDQYQNARVWFFLIIERTKAVQDQADAWLNIACCYRLESNFEKAQKAIIKAKELAPTDPFIDEEEKNIISALERAAPQQHRH